MSSWKRNMPYRAIDPVADPRDTEDHSGSTEEDRDSYDDEPDDAEAYEYDPIETP